MLQYNHPTIVHQFSDLDTNRSIKGQIDLIVLRHMARCVLMTLQTQRLEATNDTTIPQLFEFTERKRGLHRTALYKPEVLLAAETIAFVGFVSAWQERVDEEIKAELYRADRRIFPALLDISGLLGYSSLELRPGRWYNLVLLQNLAHGAELKESSEHQYAAYTLAPKVYQWIRLHHGLFPGGLVTLRPRLLLTKHYSFQEEEQNFRMFKVAYE